MPSKPPTYQPANTPTRQQRERDYDRRRGSAHSRGYTNRLRMQMDAWKAAHPLCLGCSAVGRVAATEVTDHIIPHKGDQTLLHSPDNWQPACREHHDVVKQRLEALYLAGSIKADHLRLDSAKAIEITRDFLF